MGFKQSGVRFFEQAKFRYYFKLLQQAGGCKIDVVTIGDDNITKSSVSCRHTVLCCYPLFDGSISLKCFFNQLRFCFVVAIHISFEKSVWDYSQQFFCQMTNIALVPISGLTLFCYHIILHHSNGFFLSLEKVKCVECLHQGHNVTLMQ